MPTVNGKYVSPTWHNDAPPALEETELQAITDWLAHHAKNGHAIGGSDPLTVDDVGAAPKNLSSETAIKFQAGNVTADQALSILGDYNLYWWKRRTYSEPYTISVEQTSAKRDIISQLTLSQIVNYPYSSEVNIDSSGVITLKNPQYVSLSYDSYANANALRGKFVWLYWGATQQNQLYYVDENSPNATRNSRDGWYYIEMTVHNAYAVKKQSVGPYEFLQSQNRNQYPDSGVSGGYEYQYIGKPLDNSVSSSWIEKTSYVGNGTWGEGNKNSLTFAGKPQLIFVSGNVYSSFSSTRHAHIVLNASENGYDFVDSGSSKYGSVSTSGNTINWWSGSVDDQLNYSGYTYNVVAITNVTK